MLDTTMTFTRLTRAQRERWDRDGYLILENALSAAEVDVLVGAIELLDEESQRKGRDPNEYFMMPNVIERDDAFLDLIDHPNHLGVVIDLLGANIQLIASELMLRPPTPEPGSRWHEDGPKPYPFPHANGLTPLLHVKIGWFLTDINEQDMGNLVLLPGSHVNGFPAAVPGSWTGTSPARFRAVAEIDKQIPGARQITVNAGDAVLFHNALWHSVARNISNVRRKNIYYVYGPLWTRLIDRQETSPELIARSNAIRQQLLGALDDHSGGLHPGEQGAPLVRAFERKSYEEVWEDQVAKRIRERPS